MANEILYSGSSDLRVAEILHTELHILLADYTDLSWAAPVIRDMSGSGTSTVKQPQVDWDDAMAAVAENASTSNTAFVDGSVTVAVARQALQRQVSDLFEITGSLSGADIMAIAGSMALAYVLRKTDMVAGLIDNFATTAGTSTVDLSVDDMYSAIYSLMQSSVPPFPDGTFACALYPVQYTDFVESLRGESGAQQFIPATQAMMAAKGPGYKGAWNGVSFWTSDSVVDANGGADSAGGIWGPGALVSAVATQNVIRGAGEVVYADALVAVEFERDAAGALTKIVGNAWYGVSENEDLRGVSIITDR